jgi:hypothetical protein
LSDGLADAGATTGHDGVLHVTAWRSTIKNRPSDYENRTLGNCDPARQSRNPIRTGETFEGGLSHPKWQAGGVLFIRLSSLPANV